MSSEDSPSASEAVAVEGTGPVQPIRSTSAPDPHLVSLLEPVSFAAEQYETLRHLVERAHEAKGLRIVAVTSPAPGDGKTLTAINLAGALARPSRGQVLIIEADLRRPAVLAQLGLDLRSAKQGLAQVASDPSVALGQMIRYSPTFNLCVLAAGECREAPYDVLSSPSLGRLFDLVRRHFDYVVVDTPPAVGFPDYRLLEKWADGTLLVVAAGVTPRKMVELALGIVDPEKALGIVFNRADVGTIARYYNHYYRSQQASLSRP